jgi:hypothetical protein
VSRKRTVKGTVSRDSPRNGAHHKKEMKPQRHPLKFGKGNAKLDDAIFTFSLPAGYTCPCARACLTMANRKTGAIADGPETQFRCYAATLEVRPVVRRAAWHNLEALRSCRSVEEMTQLILDSLTPFAGFVRIHVSGDFFSQDYFDAWIAVAKERTQTLFYTYTKSLPYWVARLGSIPRNFVLTASTGGQQDHLIGAHGLRYAQVVFSEAESEQLGLPIDHDDSHAMQPGGNFALLLHGTQPADTEAARAMTVLKSKGWYGYSRKAGVTSRRFRLKVL